MKMNESPNTLMIDEASPMSQEEEDLDVASQVGCNSDQYSPISPVRPFNPKMVKRKKHNRRAAFEIARSFDCPYTECSKSFGCIGS